MDQPLIFFLLLFHDSLAERKILFHDLHEPVIGDLEYGRGLDGVTVDRGSIGNDAIVQQSTFSQHKQDLSLSLECHVVLNDLSGDQKANMVGMLFRMEDRFILIIPSERPLLIQSPDRLFSRSPDRAAASQSGQYRRVLWNRLCHMCIPSSQHHQQRPGADQHAPEQRLDGKLFM